jgi:hypothetical protein
VSAFSRHACALAVGLWVTQLLPGQEPAQVAAPTTRALSPKPSANQLIADTIAERLQSSGQLRHYHVDVAVNSGTAQLTGCVADQLQHDEAIRLAQGVPGVERVHDGLIMTGAIRQAQDVEVPSLDAAAPKTPALPPAAPSGAVDPMPIFQAAPSPYDLNPPKMPPYAWPTYAPYNNYSRVAYPTLYPYNSWPFVGPNYPFPKIPPNWRKVSLEWQDGYWWYGPKSNSHDWWRLRYW